MLCWFCLQERRKEYEANMQKAGLELELEDKAVRDLLLIKLHQSYQIMVKAPAWHYGRYLYNIRLAVSAGF